MLTREQLKLYHEILDRGLCNGVGDPGGQMCIEAAVCQALGLPHGDNPRCVEPAVRAYKITLNDSAWSSPEARGAGLRKLGLAQLGSKGVIDGPAFAPRLAEATIRELIPALFRVLPCATPEMLAAADRCEAEGTRDAAYAADASAQAAAYAAYATGPAAYAAYATRSAAYAAKAASYAPASAQAAACAARAANAARAAAYSADASAAVYDRFLLMSADIALRVLAELGSPGVALLSQLQRASA